MPSTHPPGCYYVNIVSGTIQRQCNAIAVAGLAFAGFVGCNGLPAIPENACATFQDAQNFANSSTGSSALNTVTGWTDAIGNAFTVLTQRQTWIRIAEGLIGIGLIGIGVYVLIREEAFSFTGLGKALK